VVQDPIVGREAIRKMFAFEFSQAEMVCIPEIIHEAGEVAVLEWRDRLASADVGSSLCATGGSSISAAIGIS
jgi:hypothetical protein